MFLSTNPKRLSFLYAFTKAPYIPSRFQIGGSGFGQGAFPLFPLPSKTALNTAVVGGGGERGESGVE